MNFDQQVCALEYAKRLRELGVEQKSLHRWCEYPHLMVFNEELGKHECKETVFKLSPFGSFYWREDEIDKWAAFNVAELLEMLPACFDFTYFSLTKGNDISDGYVYIARYNSLDSPDKNPANACAKMLIYLIEQGHMKV